MYVETGEHDVEQMRPCNGTLDFDSLFWIVTEKFFTGKVFSSVWYNILVIVGVFYRVIKEKEILCVCVYGKRPFLRTEN